MNSHSRYRFFWYLFFILSSSFLVGCTMEIQHGLTERQANKIIVLFAKKGITAQKIKNPEGRVVTWTITVNKSDAVHSIKILQRNNLPQKNDKGFPEIFGQVGMIPTASQERARYLMALSGEMQKTLKKISGVYDARVHIVIPQDKILKSPDQKLAKTTASILLLTLPRQFTSGRQKQVWYNQLAADAKRLIAGSVENLHQQNVSVIVRESQGIAATGSSDETNTPTVTVLTVKVAAKHAMKFRLILGGISLLLLIFLGLFAVYFTRTASLKNKLNAMNGF